MCMQWGFVTCDKTHVGQACPPAASVQLCGQHAVRQQRHTCIFGRNLVLTSGGWLCRGRPGAPSCIRGVAAGARGCFVAACQLVQQSAARCQPHTRRTLRSGSPAVNQLLFIAAHAEWHACCKGYPSCVTAAHADEPWVVTPQSHLQQTGVVCDTCDCGRDHHRVCASMWQS
jgi:hypothetical protein